MEVKNLCKAYHGRPVLQNVSFAAGVGITALWAPSGAGKTTLLRLLLGLERPDSGQLVGTDIRWSAVFQEAIGCGHQAGAGLVRRHEAPPGPDPGTAGTIGCHRSG